MPDWRKYSLRHVDKVPDAYYQDPVKRYNQIFREGICEYCGRKDLVVFSPTDWIPFCPEHALSIPGIDIVAQRGRVALAPNPGGSLKCHVCGRAAPVMYVVRFEWLCYNCLWYRLGKASRRLKADDTRIV